jgi:hypothetical protein
MNLNKIIKDDYLKKNLEEKLKKAKEIYVNRIYKIKFEESRKMAINRWILENNKNKIISKKRKSEIYLDKIIMERLYIRNYEKKVKVK